MDARSKVSIEPRNFSNIKAKSRFKAIFFHQNKYIHRKDVCSEPLLLPSAFEYIFVDPTHLSCSKGQRVPHNLTPHTWRLHMLDPAPIEINSHMQVDNAGTQSYRCLHNCWKYRYRYTVEGHSLAYNHKDCKGKDMPQPLR